MAPPPKQYKTGGDDLDDGLELDPELFDYSDGAGSEGSLQDIADGVDIEEDLPYMTDEEDKGPTVSGRKRKGDQVDDSASSQDPEALKAEKKRRKKEKDKERKAKRIARHPAESSTSGAATHLSTDQLYDMLLNSVRATFPAATPLETEDLVIPADHLLPPPDTPVPSSEHDPFYPLSERLRTLLKPLQSKKPPVSAPRVIILSLSGIRCADVVRAVKPQKGQGEVAKLFAKHFKLEDQVKYLAKTRVSVAVGTPARVGKLLAEGAIRVTKDTVILLDISYKDPKQRSLLTFAEVRAELWKSVFSGTARDKLLQGGARIGAF